MILAKFVVGVPFCLSCCLVKLEEVVGDVPAA